MNIKNFIFFTGLWLYAFITTLAYFSIYNLFPADKITTGMYTAIFLFPLIFPIFITIGNIKRYRNGEREFGIDDALGKNLGDEDSSKEARKKKYPPVPSKYLSDRPFDFVIGKVGKKYMRIPITKDGIMGLIIAAPGSGKTVLILSWLYALFYKKRIFNGKKLEGKNWNFAVMDIKPEIFCKVQRITGKYKATGRERLRVVQPSNRESYGWDVLYRVHKKGCTVTEKLKAVNDIAEGLIDESGDNPYFSLNARKILTGILFFYIEKGYDFIPIIQKITRTNLDELLTQIVKEAEDEHMGIVLDKLKSFVGKKDNESLQDVESTMKQCLDVFSYPDIIYALNDNPYRTSPEVLNSGKVSLDIAIEQSMIGLYRPIFRLITIQLLKHAESEFHEDDDRITTIIIDEAAKCGRIGELATSDISQYLATFRSVHTNVIQIFQNCSQIYALYKKEIGQAIISLCELKIFMSAGEEDTVKAAANLAGEYTGYRKNYKRGLLGSADDVKYSDDSKDIITGKDLASLRSRDEIIVFIYGEYYRIKKFKYYEDKYIGPIAKKIQDYNKNQKII